MIHGSEALLKQVSKLLKCAIGDLNAGASRCQVEMPALSHQLHALVTLSRGLQRQIDESLRQSKN